MARLNSPWRKTFTKDDFDQFPVWVWDDENFGQLPLTELSFDYGPLFIKARFKTNSYIFDGYLVGYSTYYACGLFILGHEIVMNIRLPEITKKSLQEIFEFLKRKPFNFFPLAYESDVCIDGSPISGILDFREGL